jgi:drug/metabolite transporter (DMT)-like permease
VKNRLLLISAAILFSTGGAAIKATALAGWQVASFRSLVAALALAALIPEARRGWNWPVILVGVAYASTLVLFVQATKLTTAANAIFLQDTAPLYLLLLGPFLLHERIRGADLVLMSVVALGMACFFLGEEHVAITAPNPALGNKLGALSAISWALTIAGLRWVAKRGGSTIAPVAAGNLIAGLACLPMALPAPHWHAADVGVILYLGIFQIGLAYVCMTRAIRQVPALTAATILLVEPALNPVWAWLVEGERPGALAITGGVLILSATLVHSWWQSRSRQEASAW